MKLIPLPFFLLLAACHHQERQVREFIPGTYVSKAQGPYSVAWDTIVILPASDQYEVVRRTGYQRIDDRGLSPLVRRSKNFTGMWDADKQRMELDPAGIIVFFQPADHQLTIQRTVYKKIEP